MRRREWICLRWNGLELELRRTAKADFGERGWRDRWTRPRRVEAGG